jgi:DnaJ-class molecular chaperone
VFQRVAEITRERFTLGPQVAAHFPQPTTESLAELIDAGSFSGQVVRWDFGDLAGSDVDVEDLLGETFGRGGFDRMPRRGQEQQVAITIDLLTGVLGGKRTIAIRRQDGTTQSLKVPIPAGARDGGRGRLKAQGVPSRSG